ncbi:NAD(P)/FAD-dependent oxidoreductase [Desulforamulus hydrothermalis]|uniref:FAD-dependent pyridine nucleotide-disulfide oxidoreductase n=1 Tax=Desulforamulus hydrothermalis Lam5 = DSM 18033 TaxID=1121428 RepID=K8E6Q5_9FIRM|nr:NAD(P)/FAD-dependent oxidoreductase [Desulforamulus hydrothermalis]CCO07158.1 FAD-dependent pyridine nucleotide-disulfide oxidoreductase [Desulforamulus hydrothermalis Lam5 = DSM 18033]SHG88823.1 sarcosine oxidase subunit alpha [Desulforamulus hydrothermalis Lam5 = DSM 18033]
MKQTEIAIVGGGPAGLSAALQAAKLGAEVYLIDRNDYLGGQLIKQTHRFFGSKEQRASERGIDIARELAQQVTAQPNIKVMTEATALGYYEDGVLLVEQQRKVFTVKPQRLIIATGGAEKTLLFPNNDLPGVYGAGAVQTLVNVYGVKPGQRVLMVGAGNIGVIVSYQLLQAGVEVAAIIEAAPRIGAYWVHAAKVVRAGVPIYTRHTILRAHGTREVTGATVVQLDEKWQPVAGTEKMFDVDVICLSVGLTPLTELLWQAGCRMVFVPELGGHVPLRNERLETSVPGIYVAGDVSGIEEASAAMMEGALAGLNAAADLGYTSESLAADRQHLLVQLAGLRSGPVGEKIRKGLAQVLLK